MSNHGKFVADLFLFPTVSNDNRHVVPISTSNGSNAGGSGGSVAASQVVRFFLRGHLLDLILEKLIPMWRMGLRGKYM